MFALDQGTPLTCPGLSCLNKWRTSEAGMNEVSIFKDADKLPGCVCHR